MSRVCLGLVALGLLASTPAHADQFVRPKGQGRVIVTGVFTDSPRGFDANGDVTDISDYDQDQVYVNAEYGLTDDLTLILAPSFRHVGLENGRDTTGLGYTEVGARYRFAQGNQWHLVTQGLVRIPGQGKSGDIAQIGNSSTDLDLRVGGAYTPSRFFVSGEGGYRFRSGDLPNEFHVDANIGVNATDRLLLLATAANTFSDGAGEGIYNRSYRYGDFYLSGVYRLTDRVSLQAGYTATLYGKNSLRQRGPLIGLWLEF